VWNLAKILGITTAEFQSSVQFTYLREMLYTVKVQFSSGDTIEPLMATGDSLVWASFFLSQLQSNTIINICHLCLFWLSTITLYIAIVKSFCSAVEAYIFCIYAYVIPLHFKEKSLSNHSPIQYSKAWITPIQPSLLRKIKALLTLNNREAFFLRTTHS